MILLKGSKTQDRDGFQQAADQLFCKSVYEEIAFGPQNFGYSKETEEEYMRQLKLFLLTILYFLEILSA